MTASFTSPMAAVRICGDASSEGDTRSRRIWRRRTDGASWSTWPKMRNVIWRVDASGCALHIKGRTVVRGMMISGDSSVCGGAVHSTFRRIARVASNATPDCRDVRITGKIVTKSGKVWHSDAGTWAISTNDAKEGLDRRVSRSQPRLLSASCNLLFFLNFRYGSPSGTHKGKEYRVFSILPVFENGRAIPKAGKICLEDSSRNGTPNEISGHFQCGVQERYQKGLSIERIWSTRRNCCERVDVHGWRQARGGHLPLLL